MRISRIIAITMALLASLAASAQTTDLTLGHMDCGQYHAARLYCDGIPATASDGAKGTVWFDYKFTPFAQDIYGSVQFSGGLSALGLAMVRNIQPDGSIQFSGADSKGVAYYGILSYTHTTYLKCAAGHCRTYWRITGGMASIQRVDY